MRPSPRPFFSAALVLRARLRAGLQILLEAFNHADQTRRNPWDFAVKIADLRAAGLTTADLRSLFFNKYVQHAVEKMKGRSKRRIFGKRGELLFHARSCFILTEAGVRAARVLIGEIPFYDRDLRELWVGGQLVKSLKQPAPDQDAILASFEELGWPRRIDDPLPRKPGGQDPKLRLRDTIKRLNQRHHPHLIHFRGDGRGQGIIWEFI